MMNNKETRKIRRPLNISLKNMRDYDYFYNFLTIISMTMSHLPENRMSPTEQKMLAYFLCLKYPKFKYQMFSSLARKKARAMAKEDGWIVSDVNMNTKLYSLVEKGYLYRDEDNIMHLHKVLMKALDHVHDYHELNIVLHMPFKERITDESQTA